MKPRTLLAGVLGLLVIVGMGESIVWTANRARERVLANLPTEPAAAPAPAVASGPADPYSPEEIRRVLIAGLVQPYHTGGEFAAQLLGDAHLELYRLDGASIYLSLPRKDDEPGYPASLLAKFLIDPAAVRQAEAAHARLKLDQYSMSQTPQKWHLIATRADNLKVDPAASLRFVFRRGTYTLSMRELVDFLRGESLVGGLLEAKTGGLKDGQTEVLVNHGVFVATKGEPSLQRFARDLVKDIPEGAEAREQRVQRLLDFVTEEIACDDKEAETQRQVMKRPNETLMTRRGGCGNKAILLASLLTQVGEDPLFIYVPGHLTVAVPQGRFPHENGNDFTWHGGPVLIAETTTPGFQIGRTQLAGHPFDTVEYVQLVKEPNTIISLKSGRPLSF